MGEWFRLFEETLWLRGDHTGSEDARFIMDALRLKPGDRVLDAPCGAGRVAAHLAKAGCHVSGIDLTPGFIARARQRFVAEGLAGDFRELDMRRLDAQGEFDAVYNWGGSFGYFSEEENLDVLRRMMHALKPGGPVLVDQPNREWLLRHFRAEASSGTARILTRWDAETERVESHWVSETGVTTSHSSIRLYTPSQFRRLFSDVGLSWETAYGGKDGSPYTRASRRLVVVGRRL